MDDKPVLPVTWLNTIGFTLGNPFSSREASGEPASALGQYFVARPGFEELVGSARHPRSGMLFARRGSGKTTNRLALESQCRAGQLDEPVLAITYADFERPLARAGTPARITAAHHVAEIARIGLTALFDAVADRPARAAGYVGSLRRELARYTLRYSDLLDDIGLDNWLESRGWLDEQCHAAALRAGQIAPGSAFLPFLSSLLSSGDPPASEEDTPRAVLAQFVRLARRAGYAAVYVLVDRVDEREPMAGAPAQGAALLAPLVTDLPLMELPHAAFKFFITPEVLAALRARGAAFRGDRLVVRDISWDVAGLKELLDRRVDVFSEGVLPSLDAVAETGSVVGRLATAAGGSPRNLLRLAEWLLHWHNRRVGQGRPFLLSLADVERAIASFMQEEYATMPTDAAVAPQEPSPAQNPAAPPVEPLIRLDEAGVAWVGERRVGHLSTLQHRLLDYLLAHPGIICHEKNLMEAVYQERLVDVVDPVESLEKLVQRLRRSLGLGKQGREIIRKVSAGNGYVLQQPSRRG